MVENLNNIRAWQDAVAQGKDCLSPDDLQALLQNNGSESSRQHVGDCPHCQAELAMIESFAAAKSPEVSDVGQREEIAWIVARLQAHPKTATSPPVRTAAWRNFFQLPYVVGAAAAGLVIYLGISLYVFDHQQQPALTADGSPSQPLRSGAVHLTAPSGDLAQPPASFRWEEFPGAGSYSVELLEVDGTVLWSGKSQQAVLPVGPKLQARMQRAKPLAWRVVALDSSGKIIAESNAAHFIVKPTNGRN